jgi:hypothetical protein
MLDRDKQLGKPVFGFKYGDGFHKKSEKLWIAIFWHERGRTRKGDGTLSPFSLDAGSGPGMTTVRAI